VHRIVPTRDRRFVAVGAALAGAHRAPAIWTSTDGTRWDTVDSTPAGEPNLWAVAELPDASVLTCGVLGSDRPAVGCWIRQGDGTWLAYDVATGTGSPAPQYIYAVVNTPGGLIAVGVGLGAAGRDAAVWTMRI
jgi:hypothetical protein